MVTRQTRWCIALLMTAAAAATQAQAPLALDTVTVAKLPPAHPYRLYLTDLVLPHLPDGRMLVVDGRTMKIEGMVSTGAFAQTTLSPDRSEIYVATTYFSKLNRGDRSEWILVYDGNTLELKQEIPYPARHAQALPYLATMRTSADGRFILVQNATPATSVSVVDRAQGTMVSEIATPGCYGVYPAKSAYRFSALCGDGTMLTISLDDQGKPIGKKRTPKFFDPDGDALFVAPAQDGDTYYFPSFQGNVVALDVGGEVATVSKQWSMLTPADRKKGWRPSGFQPIALDSGSGTLYAGLHPKGYEGSHKDPIREIWAFDVATGKRVARNVTPPVTGLAVGHGKDAQVYAYDAEHAAVIRFSGIRKLKKAAERKGLGDTPSQLEIQ